MFKGYNLAKIASKQLSQLRIGLVIGLLIFITSVIFTLITLSNSIRDSKPAVENALVIISIFSLITILILITTFYFLLKQQKMIALRERKYRKIFETSPDIIYLLDRNLKILDINPAISIQLGYETLKLIDTNLGLLFNNIQHQKFIEDNIAQGLTISNLEIELRHSDGTVVSYMLNLHQDNSSQSYHGSLVNITQRKKAENERLALEKFAGIGKIARIIAHEVRNPLTNINLSVESLSNNPDPEDLEDYLKIISKNSTRINNLITELLYTTKVNKGVFGKISISNLLNNTIDEALTKVELKKIELIKKFDNCTCFTEGDEQQLQMALINLIINAVESMSNKADGQLTIAAESTEEKCQITIGDTGIGIPSEDFNNIFEPFFSTKKNATGLGLATAQIVILIHGGSIHVESTTNEGSRFIILLNKI